VSLHVSLEPLNPRKLDMQSINKVFQTIADDLLGRVEFIGLFIAQLDVVEFCSPDPKFVSAVNGNL
jgi:hypothetical protein